jgi:hypothetical protein
MSVGLRWQFRGAITQRLRDHHSGVLDFANVCPSLAVGAQLCAVFRILLTTQSVVALVEIIDDGRDMRNLGTSRGIGQVLRYVEHGPVRSINHVHDGRLRAA